MICGGIFVLLDLLSSPLSDLKIRYNGGIKFVSSLGPLPLVHHEVFVMLQESQLALVLQVLGRSNCVPNPVRIFVVLAK